MAVLIELLGNADEPLSLHPNMAQIHQGRIAKLCRNFQHEEDRDAVINGLP